MEGKDEDKITRNHLKELYTVFFDEDTIRLFELKERELLILQLRWLEGKTFAKIGEEVGLSQQGVSDSYTKILKRLNKKMYWLAVISKRQFV
jgi:RNA polymerase sigma factor (sigma-70 family)